MKNWIVRASLSAILGLGVVAGLARADDKPPSPLLATTVTVSEPIVAHQDSGIVDGKRRPVKEWLQRHNLCCWSHHNLMGCGSFKSDLRFIFGSCRDFFGEPCLPGPGYPPTAYSRPLPSNGCRCP